MTEDQSFRDRLNKDLDERYGKLLEVIDGGLSAKTTTWVNCPSCKKRNEVEVVDIKSALAAADFITAQSLGRPGIAPEGEAGEQIKLLRITHYEGVGAEQFEALQSKVQAIVTGADDLPVDVTTALMELIDELGDIADVHAEPAPA